jgi:hypothetical protein
MVGIGGIGETALPWREVTYWAFLGSAERLGCLVTSRNKVAPPRRAALLSKSVKILIIGIICAPKTNSMKTIVT